MIPEKVIQDWISKETYIQNKLNQLNKKAKKLEKKRKHYEMRLRLVKERKKNELARNSQGGK